MASLLEVALKALETVARVVPDHERDPLDDATTHVGKPYDRVDGRLKVTGRATYSAEYRIDNLTHAALVHSAIAKGRITQIDSNGAEQLPGVLLVMTHQNAPTINTPGQAFAASLLNPLSAAATTLPTMQSADVFWNGQVVAVVVAETPELARYASTQIRVWYEEETPALSLEAGKPAAFAPSQVALRPAEIERGDAETGLAEAPVRVDEVYTTPMESTNALEPHATLAVWRSKTHLTLYDSTQYPSGVRDTVAGIFGLKTKNVRVITKFIGGGFGGKASAWSHVPLAIAAAQLVRRPVKLVLTRTAVNFLVGGRTQTEQRVALGATSDGRLTALLHGGYSMCTKDVFAEQFTMPARHLYASPNIHVWQKVVRLDRLQNSFVRAPGECPGTFALESAMDELAHVLRMDPVELRLLNEPARDPTHDDEFSSRFLRECYALGAHKFGWDPVPAPPGRTREGDWLIGTGVASAFYPTQQLMATVKARITVAGMVAVRTATTEMGVGAATVQMQHIAERFGVPFEQVSYAQGDSDLPTARVMGGSAATLTVGSAIQAAADKLTDELLKLARKNKQSPLYRAARESVELRNGGLYRTASPDAGESFGAILMGAHKRFVEVEASSAIPVEAMKYSMASYGAHFCGVRVHALTGEVRVTRFVSVLDCGRIINPKTARSQIIGGIVMGIGMALHEETVFDERTGRLMNPTLAEYHVPVQADIPSIDVFFIDKPDPHTTLGAKSCGEVGMTGSVAAVANAVFRATGRRIRHLPITADKLL